MPQDKWAQYEVTPQAQAAPQADKWAQYEVKQPAQPAAAPTQAAPSALQTGLQYGKEIIGGVGRGLTGLAQGTQQMVQPRTPGEQSLSSSTNPLNYIIPGLGEGIVAGKHLIGDTAKAVGNMYQAQKEAGQHGEGWAGRTLAAAEQAPMIGGAVQHAELGGPHMFSPQSVGAAAELGTYYAVPKIADEAVVNVNRFLHSAKSVNDVTKAGAGVYQGEIQPPIMKLQAAIQQEGARTIQGLVDADKQDAMVKGTGSISTAKTATEAAKAIQETGYEPKPGERDILEKLTSDPTDKIAQGLGYQNADMARARLGAPVWESTVQNIRGSIPELGPGGLTMDEAVKLRSAVGSALNKAQRAGNAKFARVLSGSYDELGKAIGDRAQELGGAQGAKAWEHYNNEFKSYYELRKGITGDMMDGLADRHEAIPKLQKFAGADLTEVKDAMKKYGLDPRELDKAQENAQSVVNAHKAMTGKMRQSLYSAAMVGGLPALLGMGIYGLSRGAGLYGFMPYLLATYGTAAVGGVPDRMKVGDILQKLNVNPESFQVRNPVEGPMKFNINPDEAYQPPSKVGAVKSALRKRRAP